MLSKLHCAHSVFTFALCVIANRAEYLSCVKTIMAAPISGQLGLGSVPLHPTETSCCFNARSHNNMDPLWNWGMSFGAGLVNIKLPLSCEKCGNDGPKNTVKNGRMCWMERWNDCSNELMPINTSTVHVYCEGPKTAKRWAKPERSIPSAASFDLVSRAD